MKLLSWFGFGVFILIIIFENQYFELKFEYKRDVDCVIRSLYWGYVDKEFIYLVYYLVCFFKFVVLYIWI